MSYYSRFLKRNFCTGVAKVIFEEFNFIWRQTRILRSHHGRNFIFEETKLNKMKINSLANNPQ